MSLSEDEDDYLSADEDCLTAPPPTPALSSSFASDEQTKWANPPPVSPKPKMTSVTPTNEDFNLKETPSAPETNPTTATKTTTTPTSSHAATAVAPTPSQYGWRIPTKNTLTSKQQTIEQTSKEEKGDDPTPKPEDEVELKTRLVFDEMSRKLSKKLLSHHDKNLIDIVKEDIKRLSIKTDAEEPAGREARRAINLPTPSITASITDLGTTLGGWSWSGASKILASASLVTSQVGSVLDSVVNPKSTIEQSEQQQSNKPDDQLD